MNKVKVIEVKNVIKDFIDVNETVNVLKGVNLVAHKGESVAILGSSGSGKSTLLQIMGGLESLTSGSVILNNTNIFELSDKSLSKFRNENIGFVYQFHHLMVDFNALENVAMPLIIRKECSYNEALDRARKLLLKVGLEHRINHIPSKLSGGEKQRVAIARALINNPKILLADEPTGNLDKGNAQAMLNLMLSVCNEMEASLILVTHDEKNAENCTRVLKMDNGVLKEKNV